jgi:hypothetical protein
MKVAETVKAPSELVNPLIKHKVVSVEEKIEEICAILETQEEASLFFLLKDADSRAELVARFMGVLELVKLRRILITTVTVIDDVVEYNERGLEMMFTLNPDYVPTEGEESEFDAPPKTDEEDEKENDDK